MRKKIKIVFAAQDPGGINAILPVIEELKKKKSFLLKIILSNQSRDIAKKHKINYQDGNLLTDKGIVQLLKKELPDLIFIATSQGLSIEKRIIKIAKKNKIETVALIDFWTNYKLRFSNPGKEDLAYLPDYILVIDKIMKKEMLIQGFDSKKITITGSPFFDSFEKLRKIRKKENFISFFCQPFSELFKKSNRDYPGYNEIQVFEDLVKVLGEFQIKMPIKVKFHPRAKRINKFDRIMRNSKLDISIEKKILAEDLIKQSKLVIGMNSMVLFQAAMIGKKVLSYQPNLKGIDRLISNRLGLSVAVYKKKDLFSVFKKIFLDKTKKKNLNLIKKYTQNKSTQRVINFILKI